MIKSLKYLLALVVLTGISNSCKKITDGFLSPLVRYEEDPIIIQKGRTKVSSALNFDGSTKPAKIRMVHIYDKATGKIVDDVFLKQYPIKIWTGLYDSKTDTTLALIDAKQKDTLITPIVINNVSGQVEANSTTLNIPAGDYEFDLEISNGAATMLYPKIGRLQIIDAPTFEANPELGTPYIRMIKVGNESLGTSIFSPVVVIERTADEPNKVILKIVDKNGIPFNPKAGEIIRRPNTGNNPVPPFLQTLQDYSLKTDIYDDRMEFTYGVLPFPLASLGNGYNIYYRIPTQFFSHDDQVKFPDGQYSANPRFVFRAYVPGTYTITYRATDITHK